MSKMIHLRSYLEGPRWTSLDKFLIHCSEKAEVNLTIIDNYKHFLTQHIDFKVSGEETNVNKFQHIIDEALDNFKVNSFTSNTFNVEELKIISPKEQSEEKNNIYIATVKTHRFSAIKRLGEKIRDQFDMNIHIKEENNFLSKKVTFTVRTPAQQFVAFKNIFFKFVVSSQPFTIVNELDETINKTKPKIKM